MTVYTIALLKIEDRTQYARYEQGFMAIFNQYEGKLLAVDETPIVKEGTWNHTRTVLLQFPDAEAFDRWYHSEAYQALAQYRFGASSASVVVIKGLPEAA